MSETRFVSAFVAVAMGLLGIVVAGTLGFVLAGDPTRVSVGFVFGYVTLETYRAMRRGLR